jgi:hypothetical protein
VSTGGLGGAQKLGYFCNTGHIRSQPQRRSNSGCRTGMQGARQQGGGGVCVWELWFCPFWQLGGSYSALWGRRGPLQAARSGKRGVGRDSALLVVVMMKGTREGRRRHSESKCQSQGGGEEFNPRCREFQFVLCSTKKNQGRQSTV